MLNSKWAENIIEQKLLSLHTCYLAKILSTDGTTAKIQPLGKTKEYGKEPLIQSPLTNVPIAISARYKFIPKEIEYVEDVDLSLTRGKPDIQISTTSGEDGFVTDVSATVGTTAGGDFLTDAKLNVRKNTETIVVLEPLDVGDIVVCVCGERNITAAKKGQNVVPPVGHHSMSDSIIIGIL